MGSISTQCPGNIAKWLKERSSEPLNSKWKAGKKTKTIFRRTKN